MINSLRMFSSRVSALALSCLFSPGLRSAPTQSVVGGNTVFALEFYSQIKTNPGNIFFSPYSLSTAMAMVYAGARGETEKQMSRVLHFGEDQRQFHSAFGDLERQLTEIDRRPGVELNRANALWVQNYQALLPTFLEIARHEYQANPNR